MAPSWPCHTIVPQTPNSSDPKLFCWCIVCFCTSNGSVRLLKKARGNIFLKWYYLEEIVKIVSYWKKKSSLFQYSDRTVASAETNDTSAECLGSELFGARRTRAWHTVGQIPPKCKETSNLMWLSLMFILVLIACWNLFCTRGRSQTTFTRFWLFLPPTPLRLHFLWYEC